MHGLINNEWRHRDYYISKYIIITLTYVLYVMYIISIPPAACDKNNKANFNSIIIKKITQNIPSHQLGLFMNTSEKLSLQMITLIQKIMNQYASFTISIDDIGNSFKKNYLLEDSNAIHSMRILFLDEYGNENITKYLIEFIKFLNDFTLKSPRPKCLIIVMHKESNSCFLKFFQFAWESKYLDISIIEYFDIEVEKNILGQGTINDTNLVIHHYNPFNEKYTKQILEDNTDLFPEKLKNLYGYSLDVGVTDWFPQVLLRKNYTENTIWNALYGVDYAITNILAYKLNFSINVKASDIEHFDVTQSNVTFLKSMDAVVEGIIDFTVDYYYTTNISNLKKRKMSRFLYPSGTYLIVKQYKYKKTEHSNNFTIVIITILIVTIVFSVIMSIMYSTRNNYNCFYSYVFQIFVGMSTPIISEKGSQKIIFLTLFLVSVIFMTDFSQKCFHLNLNLEPFKKINTLEDVIDSGIRPWIPIQTIDNHPTKNDEILNRLFSISNTLENPNWNSAIYDCVVKLIDEYGNTEACATADAFGKLIAKSYSDKSNSWIISFVNQPIGSGWFSMLLPLISPYIFRFNNIFARIVDSGIISYLESETIKQFMSERKEFFGSKHSLEFRSNRDIDRNKSVVSVEKIILFFMIGYVIGFFVLLCEIIHKYKKKKSIIRFQRVKMLNLKHTCISN